MSRRGGPPAEGLRGRPGAAGDHRLSSNENPLGPSAAVLEAIYGAASELNRYPPRDDEALRAALATHYGRGLGAEHVYASSGGYEALELISRALLEPGDEVVVCPPTFGVYALTAAREGARVVAVARHPDTFALDLEGILAAVGERTRVLFLCNPNNPTGTLTAAAELERLLAALPERVVVVADEVYHHFVRDPAYPDTLAAVLAGRPLIVTRSFSKAYGLAGLRLGYGLTTPELAARVRGQRRAFHLGSLVLAAGPAALEDQAHLERSVALILEGRRYLERELARLGLPALPSEGNFVCIRPPPELPVFRQLLERGVMVRPTDRNGLPGGLRVSVGLPEANRAFVAALGEILAG